MTETPIRPLADFARRLLGWYDVHGRHDLPWQQNRTPYRVWLSEIMLQQTRLATALPYFQRFVSELPDLPMLAQASTDQVLALWSGLGYYSRARNLHKSSQRCVQYHGGDLPDDYEALLALPGIGRSTAGAILAQAWGRRHAILDGNVKRVLCRSHGVDGFPGRPDVEKRLWQLSHELLPQQRLADYTQAIMDLGATICTRGRPNCRVCPLRNGCRALTDNRVAELPVPRPNRRLPERTACWLLLHDSAGRILLQRRPPQGIWGGLWSLPEFDDPEALRTALALEYGNFDAAPVALPTIRHVFSHYALTAQPLRLLCPNAQPRIAEYDDRRWWRRNEVDRIGLPQPIRRLLAESWPGTEGAAYTDP